MIDHLGELDSSAGLSNMRLTTKAAGRRANAPGPDTEG